MCRAAAPRTADGCRRSPAPRRPSLPRRARAAPGNARPGATTRPASRARSTIARPIGCSDRDSSAAATDSTPVVETPSTPSTSVTVTRLCVSVPVLSNARHRIDAEPLEMRAALDQHACARRRRERGNDRHRRRNDERARAGHDEQRQRAIAPDAERLAPSLGAREHQRRHDDEQRRRSRRRPACTAARTDRRTSESARASRCACSTRWMMRARVLSEAGLEASTSSAPRAVDGAGEHLVAGDLLRRPRLAGDRRLVRPPIRRQRRRRQPAGARRAGR